MKNKIFKGKPKPEYTQVNVTISESVRKALYEKAKSAQMRISYLVLDAALNHDAVNCAEHLTAEQAGASKTEIKKSVQTKADQYMKGENNMTTNQMADKTKQLHLRVTPEIQRNLKEKAAALGMTLSDYIAFVIMNYDIETTNAKLDKLAGMSDKVAELEKRVAELENR